MLAVPILLTCVKGTLRLCPILEDKPEVLFLPPLPSSRNGTCVAMQTMRREARSAGLIYLARCKTDEKRQHYYNIWLRDPQTSFIFDPYSISTHFYRMYLSKSILSQKAIPARVPSWHLFDRTLPLCVGKSPPCSRLSSAHSSRPRK